MLEQNCEATTFSILNIDYLEKDTNLKKIVANVAIQINCLCFPWSHDDKAYKAAKTLNKWLKIGKLAKLRVKFN